MKRALKSYRQICQPKHVKPMSVPNKRHSNRKQKIRFCFKLSSRKKTKWTMRERYLRRADDNSPVSDNAALGMAPKASFLSSSTHCARHRLRSGARETRFRADDKSRGTARPALIQSCSDGRTKGNLIIIHGSSMCC